MKNNKLTIKILEILFESLYFISLFLLIYFVVNLSYKIDNHFNTTNKKIDNIEVIEKDIEQNTTIPYKKYLGKFEATFYCDCPICVGKKKIIRTATGTKPIANKTIAVDPKIIPLNSIVYIKNMGFFIAEDTGGKIKGNKIDIFVENHQKALNLGKKQVEIYLLK